MKAKKFPGNSILSLSLALSAIFFTLITYENITQGRIERIPVKGTITTISLEEIKKANLSLKEAMHYEKLEDGKVKCLIDPIECILKENERGVCGVRVNIEGKLRTLVYGKAVAVHLDPIEKKPLFHVLPASGAFSFATAGCNLGCLFCQNWQISQAKPEETENYDLSPAEMVELAIKNNCKSIAYTYSEPIVFYEYVIDTARLAREKGLKNLLITAGYINPKPLRELCRYIDAANVDLKGFREEYYEDIVFGKLETILNTLKIMQEEGVWIEVTNLVVPTLNDDMEVIREMCEWLRENLGPDVPLHFSRFSPMYKLRNLPPTPVTTLEKAREVALEAGLHYVYIGNVPGHVGENTHCPKCGKLLIQRIGFSIRQNNIIGGRCKFCGQKIPGIWYE